MRSAVNTKIKKLAFLFLIVYIIISINAFGITTEKVYVGLKYSFRNYRTNGDVILIDPFSKNMAVYNLSNKQVLAFYTHIGNFVIAAYDLKDSYIIVDRTGPFISKISLSGEVLSKVRFERRIQASNFSKDNIYVLLEGGQLFIYNRDLKLVSKYSFSASPAYLFVWEGKVFSTYLWNDNYDIEFVGEKPKKVGLTTPSLLVENLLIDTRGGQVLNLSNNKLTKVASYISSAYFDGDKYYIASMSNSTIYVLKNDVIISSFHVPYTPTYISKIGNYVIVLSAPYNKVMIIKNDKDISVFDTGDYPIEVFKINNSQDSFAVYCSDSGEMYYYYF